MADYRDPKVTKGESGSNVGKWIGIAVAVLVALLLLGWLLGWFADEAEEPVVVDPMVTEESTTAPTADQPVIIDPAETAPVVTE
nr:hypothetical protein [Paracoccus saliphilus]